VQRGRPLAEPPQRGAAAVTPRQAVEQPAPAVARIGHELVRDRERGQGAVGREVLEGAGQAGRVGKGHALAQVAGDLQLGIDAGDEPAEVLDDERVAEGHRRVALLAGEPAHRRVARQPRREPDRGAAEKRAPLAPGPSGRGDEIEQRPAEGGVVESVGQLRRLPQRHDVGVDRSVVETDADEVDRRVSDRDALVDAGGHDPAALGREPSLPGDPLGQRGAQITDSSMP
jgi:hypothetical protein